MFYNSGNIDLVNKNVGIKYWKIQIVNNEQIKILESPHCPASFKDESKNICTSIIPAGKSFYKLSPEQINALHIQKPRVFGNSKTGLKVWSNGIQISVKEGAEVIPVRSGTVKRIISLGGSSGYFIMIDHGKGIATGYLPLYNIKVKVGDSIAKYQPIGEAKFSNNWPKGCFVHYIIWQNQKNNNPYDKNANTVDPAKYKLEE